MKSWLALIAFSVCTSAIAQSKLMCGSSDLVPGKGYVSKEVPCSELEQPIPCTKDWTDEKGRFHSETIPCPPGKKQKTFEQVEREEEAARKRKCGRDFGQLRVGMSLDRFEECTEAATFITESVGKNGVIETWRSTFYWINVRNGKIVSYTRRNL